ncbi:hypothetical protein G9A89_017130 [Geosiphon pyriformis]|nr:hypothetical protein G9A89_017130 [Geosiphon pyriformis]
MTVQKLVLTPNISTTETPMPDQKTLETSLIKEDLHNNNVLVMPARKQFVGLIDNVTGNLKDCWDI